MSQTPQYLAIRDALISARERFRNMVTVTRTWGDADPDWVRRQSIEGFNEADEALSNPENSE